MNGGCLEDPVFLTCYRLDRPWLGPGIGGRFGEDRPDHPQGARLPIEVAPVLPASLWSQGRDARLARAGPGLRAMGSRWGQECPIRRPQWQRRPHGPERPGRLHHVQTARAPHLILSRTRRDLCPAVQGRRRRRARRQDPPCRSYAGGGFVCARLSAMLVILESERNGGAIGGGVAAAL